MASHTGETDEVRLKSFVRRARNGDADAWGALCEACRETALREADRVLHSMHDSEDVAEEFLLRLPHRLRGFHYAGSARFFAWVGRVARRDALDFARTERRETDRRRRAAAEGSLGTLNDCGKLLDLDIDLEDALTSLSSRTRKAFLMHDLEGYTYGEIARVLHTSEGAVRARCRRGRTCMRERLQGPRDGGAEALDAAAGQV